FTSTGLLSILQHDRVPTGKLSRRTTRKGEIRMKTLKVIVGGEGNVGKTSLIRQYAKGKFSEARNITLGIDITTQEFQLEGESVRLAIWDIEGQAGNRPNFYIGAQAAMLVY